MSDTKQTTILGRKKRRKRQAVAASNALAVSFLVARARGFSDVSDVNGNWRQIGALAERLMPLLMSELMPEDVEFYERLTGYAQP